MADTRYSRDHAWARPEGGRARVGLSRYAVHELGEVAFVDLPEPGRTVRAGEAVCAIDSLKSTSEVFAPVSGTVVEVNAALLDEERVAEVNRDPLDRGWLLVIEMSDPSELDALMSEERYQAYAVLEDGEAPPSR